ncbi:pentatricopeptide repeat-containing protein At5g56310-like [Punica granatum]|uniref:Uncharacterized protein n=2 Tax=Punica granatum TaxID=22663 RepID=A0A218WUX2_PUNGR|nr:pentatricopeptide repeat-containing protein At5g56310-like [Punica granatum]OWM76319.1 hypothetical protein CDL15_Pgr009965 [Punica granatum]PKI65590.1 hypothetical protein CRG98_013983 [Punica granatum]
MPLPLLPRSSLHFAARELARLLRRCSSLKQLLQVHSFILTRGLLLQEDGALLGDLIGAASSLGFSDYAYLIFTHKAYPSTRLSNAIINSLSQGGSPRDAVLEFGRIRASGLQPDSYSFPFVLRAAARLPGIEPGRQVHCQAIGAGFDCDVHVATALVQFYSASGRISNARRAFDEMSSSGFLPLWNAMIAGLVRAGEANSAAEVFETMPARNVITWTTLIAGFSQLNRPKEAVEIFHRMQLEGPKPDEITMSALLSACAELGALELGEWARGYIGRSRLNWTIPLNNALIDMYSKSGKVDEAVRVFEGMKRKNIISWTTMIAGLSLNGMGKEALDMFNRMQQDQVLPNDITFIAVLSGCCHSGLVQTGFQVFEIMRSRYSMEPKIEHYGCMIDLLGRGGHLREAEDMLRSMPHKANAAIWGSLLAAARTHGDTGLAERALERLAELEPENSGNFALLSNLYAGLGRWKDAGMVRKVLRDMGTKKKRGWSSIELNGEVCEFMAEDGSHVQSGIIYEVLLKINGQLKVVGDVKEEGNDKFD